MIFRNGNNGVTTAQRVGDLVPGTIAPRVGLDDPMRMSERLEPVMASHGDKSDPGILGCAQCQRRGRRHRYQDRRA